MKKMMAFLFTMLMLANLVPALAETDLTQYSVTNAVIRAAKYTDITAPASGTLLPFDAEAGDAVQAGDVVFSLMTTDIYAPEDGTVTALFANVGDDADALMNAYGQVASIEPDLLMRIKCNIQGAYNEEENKYIHVGETLYFESAKADKEKGNGRVIAVNGGDYVVEILEGEFDNGESLTMYRNANKSSASNVGKGTVERRAPLSVAASGIVTDCAVTAGQHVKAGDKLFTLLPGCTDRNVKPVIQTEKDGVIATIAVAAGQQVWKGQQLCRIYHTDRLELIADVDEMDLGKLAVGDSVIFTLDTDSDRIISGRVSEISSLGVQKQNASYYTVHVQLYEVDNILLGQSASLYLPKDEE